jgi:DeoR/GlpR family transcriptional regulator of sugar metabolism
MSRQAQILEIIQSRGFLSVRDLASEIQADESTVRRHLHKLESLDLVIRTHGGVSPVESSETPSLIKQSIHANQKKAIGRMMASQIKDGQVVLLDSGSTTLEVAKSLKNSTLTVVTNDLRIAMEVSKTPSYNLVLIGGEVLPNLHTTWGPTAVHQIEKLSIEVAIFGADAVSPEGIFNNTGYELETKRAMLAISSEAFFVADSSKFQRKALFKVFTLDQFTTGITDDSLDPIDASKIPLSIIRVEL